MTDIFVLTNNALAAISPAVPFAMDDYSGTPLPDTYIVYTLIVSPPEQHADNQETERSYTVQVNIMKTIGLTSLPDVDTPMLAAGFKKGPIRELERDQGSAHFGLAKDYVILLPS
ncbi:MAG: hypothetical protein HY865_09615 [Chloroflexi bacterium]|nr:hypothetical protein [Chloroflexota bacterium]